MEASVAQSRQADPTASDNPGPVSVSFNLPPAEAATLRELASELGVSITQVLRQAIAEKKFFRDQLRTGKKVLLQQSDGALTQVTWTP
jgi:hypothetical protein